jgi:DNA repair protein RadD
MTYTLRPYQEQAVQIGVNYFNSKNKNNAVIVQPTAAGKSLVIANIANRLAEPVIVFQPNSVLLEQNYEKFISYGNEASIYSASKNSREIGKVTFATIGSVYKHPELFEQFKNVIVDECHLVSPDQGSMYSTFFNHLKVKCLGLTATPFRLKSYSFPEPHSKLCMLNRMIPKTFKEILFVTQIEEMVENGWWSPLIYRGESFDRSELQLNSNGSSYTDKSMVDTMNSQSVSDKVVSHVNRLRKEGRKKILIFMPTIQQSDELAKKLGTYSLTSNTSKEDREKYLSEFRSGKIWGLVNVNILSVGFDDQKIDAIVDAYPTLSLARYYQRLGRGVRIDLSDNPTKKDCIIVDLVGNYDMFGDIQKLHIDTVNGKWCITSGDKILTNTPLHKGEVIPELREMEMGFGKFKGEKFKDTPKWYWQYILKTFVENEKNRDLIRYARSVV